MGYLRTTVFLLFLIYSNACNAQKISIQRKGVKLEAVFSDIRKQSGYDFLYNSALTEDLKPVNISVKDADINEALHAVLAGTPLTYTISDKIIMIKAKSDAARVLQTFSISGVVKDKDGQALPGAAVFLGGYKIGTVADSRGKFQISNLRAGKYDLLVQMVGYIPASKSVMIGNGAADIEIILTENVKLLYEVVVRPDPRRSRFLKIFEESFLGTTPNALKCKILNPNIIDFDYDEEKQMLSAHTDEFIVVENKALGYRIRYLLKSFKKDEKNKLVYFYGYPYFEELMASKRDKIRYQAKRMEAYKGSPEHFFSSLYNNSYQREGYLLNKLVKRVNAKKPADSLIENKIKHHSANINKGRTVYSDSLYYWTKMKKEPDTLRLLDRTEILGDTLVKQDSIGLKRINFTDALYVIFTREKESNTYFRNSGFKINRPPEYSNYQISVIHRLKSPIRFYRNGRLFNPAAVVFEGYNAYERVADMVPMDYIPLD
ncbi:MAG TPA: carboxypeptidase-like regulatory domain-containing protein [Pedobacter sp.]|uniref:carboxypeptidase-like regulatory domain-containing protein n=1 Tax=Pedobacter sp. TaxID=1411316 RepID=UPI002B9758CF|nr:carboxypeptidase-like regulatory domain-containing protein [Pedobacter sp.]HMI02934.1 carboxypeptidase-like regulatory domain-containing protein [Pedobacter sp.]